MPSKGKRRSGRRKKPDPKKPKRAMSSFMYFANEKRPDLRKSRPDLKITEIGKELGRMWKDLPEEEKQKFVEKANEAKQEYLEAMKHYEAPPSSSDDESDGRRRRRRRKKKEKDPNKPKRSMSSFMFFANEKRPEVRQQFPDLKITEIGKKLSEMWKNMTDEEKQKYIDAAEKDKTRYQDAMKIYNAPTAPVVEESSEESGESEEESDED